MSRGIFLSAEHVAGTLNVEADIESILWKLDAEWMLRPGVFRLVCQMFHTVAMDLFATRINAHLPNYVSWKPDPASAYVNAFSFCWINMDLNAFPPFSIIGSVLKKIEEEQATLLIILPLRTTQVWFPSFYPAIH